MSIQVNKGAVKFKSIAAMARSVAKHTGEPVSRVYIRMWKRINELDMSVSEAYHNEARKYEMKEQIAA